MSELVIFLIMAALLFGSIYLMVAWGKFVERRNMSSKQKAPTQKADMDAVYIPVPHTSMDAHTATDERDITDDYEMPRIGRRLSDDEIITLLATQKGVDGAKYRFSANEIAQIMKGDRNTRLDQVRTVREGPPAPQVREHQAKLAQIQASPR